MKDSLEVRVHIYVNSIHMYGTFESECPTMQNNVAYIIRQHGRHKHNTITWHELFCAPGRARDSCINVVGGKTINIGDESVPRCPEFIDSCPRFVAK